MNRKSHEFMAWMDNANLKEVYLANEGVVRELAEEMVESNREVCCVIDILHKDFKFWFTLVSYAQQKAVEALSDTSQTNRGHSKMFNKVSVGVMNNLLFDMTFQLRETVLRYEMRLRYLETLYLLTMMNTLRIECRLNSDIDQDALAIADKCDRYMGDIVRQIAPLTEPVLACAVQTHNYYLYSVHGPKWKGEEPHFSFTPEELIQYMEKEWSMES